MPAPMTAVTTRNTSRLADRRFVAPAASSDSFAISVKRDGGGPNQPTTTVEWADGKALTFAGGIMPEWPPDALGETTPYYSTSAAERREVETMFSLPRGVLDRER
jgi:hypothetical protein